MERRNPYPDTAQASSCEANLVEMQWKTKCDERRQLLARQFEHEIGRRGIIELQGLLARLLHVHVGRQPVADGELVRLRNIFRSKELRPIGSEKVRRHFRMK